MRWTACVFCKHDGSCENQRRDLPCLFVDPDLDKKRSWEWLVKVASHYGWVETVTPTKEEVDRVCKGHIRETFEKRYESFLINPEIPLVIYRGGFLYYDTFDRDELPRIIDSNIPYNTILEIMKLLSHKEKEND